MIGVASSGRRRRPVRYVEVSVMGQVNSINRPTSVLVVEDEIFILEMMIQALEERGFEVHAVSNAGDALRFLTEGCAVDVLFTDINLPGGMDGSDLARLARQMRPELPVVYASGGVSALSPQRAVPGSTFVPKPYDPTKICEMLNQLATAH
jgi:CheY-like chemotaxis protein